MTGYLPLAEAAQYVTNKTGKECEPDALLRAGVHGALLIAAAFSGQMRNLTADKKEEYSGLLTIPPRYLLEIDTHGKAIIERAFSLDGKNGYAPLKIRTREQLRVLVSELDRFIPYIVEITPQHQAAPTGAPDSIDSPPVRRNTEDLVTTKQIAEAFPPPKHIKPENWQKNLGDAPAWVIEARKFSGGPGVSALWNPAMFALCMVSERHISKQAALNIIRREFPGFLDEWEENSSHL